MQWENGFAQSASQPGHHAPHVSASGAQCEESGFATSASQIVDVLHHASASGAQWGSGFAKSGSQAPHVPLASYPADRKTEQVYIGGDQQDPIGAPF